MSEEYQTNLLTKKQEYKDETFDIFINERNPQINSHSIISFTNCVFEQACIFENINAKELGFYNCKFKKEFFLSKSKVAIIGFTDCVFTKDCSLISNDCSNFIILRRINAPQLKVNGEYNTFQIVSSNIENLNIGDINPKSSNKESKIEFLVENKINRLKIEPYSTYSQIVFKGGIYKDVHFEGTFNNRVAFEKKMKIQNLYFESSSFKYRIDFEEGYFEYVNFYRSSFEGLVYFIDFSALEITPPRDLVVKKLSLHSCNFEKDISVQISKIENLSITNNFFKQQLILNNCNDMIDKSSLIMVFIDGTNQGNIILERLYADVQIGGINFGNIIFKDSSFWSIFISDFDNKGSISFNKIKSSDFFTIQNSVSGKINFINSNINDFGEIVMANSNIEGANFNKYPNKILSYSTNPKIGYGLEDKSKSRSNLRNVYNQLKQIAKKEGDIDISNKYSSKEQKQLLLSKKLSFDSILLFLNLISNNNGRSWFIGVLFTLSIAFLFFRFYLYVLNIEFVYFDSLKDYAVFISTFPKLELDKYTELNSKWSVSLVVWLSRIFISYGIYQTISAFRKYGKI